MLAIVLMLALFQALQPPGAAKHLTVFTSTGVPTAAAASKMTLYRKVSLFLDVTPNAGIHVYAPGAKDYLPVALKLDATRGVTASSIRYPKAQTMTFEGQKVPVYDQPFRVVQVVTLDLSLKPGETITVAGTFSYQACDDQVCFIPANVPLRWTINVPRK